MPLSFADALAQIERREAVRRAAHKAESLRQQFSGFGCDLGVYAELSEAEKRAQAQARVAAYNGAEAALKRELIAAAGRGMDGAYKILCAADRGDASWADQARKLFAAHVRRAA
jgi:hypothetical protein